MIASMLIFALALTACFSSGHTHSFGKWSVAESDIPTATTPGTAKRSCECGEVDTLSIPMLTDDGYTISENTAAPGVAGTGTYSITLNGITFTFRAATPALPENTPDTP